ncbi:MAG: hypothetical protein HC767_13375, partial [Akkermansiaceae bacterium]|nr:hypothetical protein [Akkermansiaceae bacterium]
MFGGTQQFRNDGTLGPGQCARFNFNPFNFYQTPQERFAITSIGRYEVLLPIAFVVVMVVANSTGREDLAGYRGLAWRGGAVPAVAMAIFLFSLTGLPPTPEDVKAFVNDQDADDAGGERRRPGRHRRNRRRNNRGNDGRRRRG